jgi:hypothetical protein
LGIERYEVAKRVRANERTHQESSSVRFARASVAGAGHRRMPCPFEAARATAKLGTFADFEPIFVA